MGKQRTVVYVDGFNLYHGALRHTPYKWLDILSLVKKLIDANKEIVKIVYFTAKVSPRPNDPDQPFRQQLYLRALKTLNAQIVYGRYLSHVVKMYDAREALHRQVRQVCRRHQSAEAEVPDTGRVCDILQAHS